DAPAILRPRCSSCRWPVAALRGPVRRLRPLPHRDCGGCVMLRTRARLRSDAILERPAAPAPANDALTLEPGRRPHWLPSPEVPQTTSFVRAASLPMRLSPGRLSFILIVLLPIAIA